MTVNTWDEENIARGTPLNRKTTQTGKQRETKQIDDENNTFDIPINIPQAITR